MGVRRKTNEIVVATPGAVVYARSVKRLPKEKRWGEDSVNWVTWAPWNRYKDHGEHDGDLPEGVPAEEKRENTEKGPTKVFIDVRDTPPRDFPIHKKDGEKHGFTRGCGGCSSWFKGLGRQEHNEACRARFRELLKDEQKMNN